MSQENKAILERANAAVKKGDYEGFLSCCTDDTEWTFVGERTLRGKEAVRRYIEATYIEPPTFSVEHLVAEDDFVVAMGKISLKDENGKVVDSDYCDVWRTRDGKLFQLKAFVVPM